MFFCMIYAKKHDSMLIFKKKYLKNIKKYNGILKIGSEGSARPASPAQPAQPSQPSEPIFKIPLYF